MGKRQVCEITSEDESVTVVTTPDGRCCNKVDLSATGGGGGGAPHMRVVMDIAAGQGGGTVEVGCIDDADGVTPFTPKYARLSSVDQDGGGTWNTGSDGWAMYGDGQTIVRYGCLAVYYAVTFQIRAYDFINAYWGNLAGNQTYLVPVSATTTQKLKWSITDVGGGYPGDLVLDVWGVP